MYWEPGVFISALIVETNIMCVFCRMYGYGLEEESVMPCNASLQTCTPSMYLTGSPVSAHCAQLMDGSVSGADLRLDLGPRIVAKSAFGVN